jgi:hypothetical protein
MIVNCGRRGDQKTLASLYRVTTKNLGAITILGIFLLASDQTHGAVAQWTFDSGDTSNPYNATTLNSFVTSGSLNVAPASGSTITHISTGGNPSGRIAITGNGQNVVGSTLTFTLNTSGATFNFSTFTFDYNRADTLKSPTGISWSYNISGGGGSGSLTATTLSSTGWQGASVDLSAINLNDGQNLTLVATLTGSGSGNPGDLSFDNLNFNATVTPVPEPVHAAMLVFGLVFLFARLKPLLLNRS